jgi:hypothetical protein
MSPRDSVAQTIGRSRDRPRLRWLEDLVQDVRYGVRTLRRAPIVAVLAIATLTLAIGANTAIFSVVDPLPMPIRSMAIA